ncbi:ATP-binding protein [Rhizohabitans arisaemae]|uniref:ATP-binding protein n=1 Tax=Rhizohabitans arisaemae TaxID=2720610 RepID=UPI0024B1C267|nr:ATP-binding protein [Rhizohabitans arisaemae]
MRRVLGDALRSLGVTEGCVSDILLAASEACANVVRHGGPTLRYQVIANVGMGRCVLAVADHGQGLPEIPDHYPPPEAENGRGIQIMKAVVDEVTFDSTPGVGTTVWLKKQLDWQDDAPLPLLERELAGASR